MVTSLSGFVSPGHRGGNGHGGRPAGATANGSTPGPALPFRGPAEPAWRLREGGRYCPMLAIDIKAFNDRRRGEHVQRLLRTAMYDLLACAFSGSGLPWPSCHHEDRGDGVLVVAPPGAPATALIDPLVDHLRAGIRRHNNVSSELARIRLRMSVHAGQVQFDENGVCGYAVTLLFRMLDAAAFKRALDASGADFALVASGVLYDDVISEGPGLIDPDMYAPITIRRKETRSRAWLYLPPVRNPFLANVSGSRRQAGTSGSERTGQLARARRRPAQGGGDGLPGDAATAALTPLPAPRPTPLPAAASAAVPRPRGSEPEDPSGSENTPARPRLLAGQAVAGTGRHANVPGGASAQTRFRGRLHPGQRF